MSNSVSFVRLMKGRGLARPKLHSSVSRCLAALVDTREVLVHTESCSTKFPNFSFPGKSYRQIFNWDCHLHPSSLSLFHFKRVSSGKVVLPKFFWFCFCRGENNRFPVEHVLLYCDFYQFSSCSPWENSRHFKTPLLVSTRNDVWATFAEISYWWLTASQAISLAEKRDLTIIQHQSGSTDPERSLV